MIILAVDLGHARTGLAVCDQEERLASPLKVVRQWNQEKLVAEVAAAAKEAGAELIVMGLPRNMDGSEGESAEFAREMGAKIGEAAGVPVDFLDERGTTVTAHLYLDDTQTWGKKRRNAVDAVSAVIILEDYLRGRRNRRGGAGGK